MHFLFASPGNEPILLNFLNAVLESDHQPLAKSVVAKNPFNPQTFITEKHTILDVKATGERGDIFVVEFQTYERASFANRLTYYGSRAFGGQMLKGEPYSTLNAVLAIAVTTFEMFEQLVGIHNSFRLTAMADHNVILANLLQIHVIEACPEKIDRAAQLPPLLQTWVNFFYYAHQISEAEMSTLIEGQPEVISAYESYLQFNQDERLRSIDEAHQRFLHDLATDIEEAHEKGIVKGVLKGKIEEKVDIARNMLQEGCNMDLISRITGLSSGEIENLN